MAGQPLGINEQPAGQTGYLSSEREAGEQPAAARPMASARDAASKLEQSRAAVRRINQDMEAVGIDTNKTHYIAGQPFKAGLHEDTFARVGALMTPKCGGCGRVDEQRAFLKCAGCKVTLYCSRACQKKDWKTHKPKCKKLRRCRKTEVPTTADGAYTFEGLALLYQEHAMSRGRGNWMEFAHTEQATGRRSGLWPSLWNVKSEARPAGPVPDILKKGLPGVPDIVNNPPDMLRAPPNDAGATALRAGGHWEELYLRQFGRGAFEGMAAPSWEKMYEKVREASRQHPLRWNEGFVLRPFVNRFVWFRLPGESGLHSPKQTLLDRIAFDGPVLRLDQAAYERAHAGTEFGNPTPEVLYGPCSIAAPQGQDYFTLEQFACALHAYYFRTLKPDGSPAKNMGFPQKPGGGDFFAIGRIAPVDDALVKGASYPDAVYGCTWV